MRRTIAVTAKRRLTSHMPSGKFMFEGTSPQVCGIQFRRFRRRR
jgi:hypothetical protein